MTDQPADLTVFRQRLEVAGLGSFTEPLVALARRGFRLVPDPVAPVVDRSSRLGGSPDLPPSTPWPRGNGGPLSFVAQVSLTEVADHDPAGLLPRDGLLSFFYDAAAQSAWGFDPTDRGSAAVVFTPGGAPTERRAPPVGLAKGGVFPALPVRPREELTFAPWESYDVERLGMTRDQEHAYGDLLPEPDDVIHRFLGHPDLVQGDMQVECQLVTNGLYCGDPSGYRDPRAAGLRDGAAQWRLLLQVDSQAEAEMMWGDAGRLYFWMRLPDLIDRNWESSWLILQCG